MKLSRRRFVHLAAGAATLPAFSCVVRAQSYPTRAIRLVVPFPPGGTIDAIGRSWADKMKSVLGTVVVENVGGAGGSVGAAAVAHAPSDGYTILAGGTQTHVNEVLLKTRPLYDSVNDLDPIATVVTGFLCIAVHPSVPAQTLKELVAYAKANPSKLSYGHAGVGTLNHLAGELFKSLTGIPEIAQVPYRGAGPVIADLIGGQIPMGVIGFGTQALELHRAEKIRVLAVTSRTRLVGAPDFPTAAETGATSSG
jgi:tripartite-type tricarboxylate transporter receptor subunit TctC